MKYQAASALAVLLATAAPVAAQDAFTLNPIIFSAGLTALEADQIGVSVDVVTEEDLRAEGDAPLADYLATLPGLSVTRNGPPGTSTTVRIRGAGGGFVAVYIDGIPVNDPTSTSGQFNGFANLSTAAINRVEVLRGSQSATYGTNAVAGVISIYTARTEDVPEGTSQYAAVEAGSYETVALQYGLEQRTGPLTLSFNISHAQSDGFSAAEENAGNSEPDSSSTSFATFGVAYEVTPNLRVGANLLYRTAESEFDEFVGFAPGDGTPGDDISDSTTAGIRAFAEYETGTLSHSLALTYTDIERSSVSEGASPFRSEFEGSNTTAQYVATTESLTDTTLSLGIDWAEETGTSTGFGAGTRSIRTAGIFGEALWSGVPGLDVVASLRHENNSSFGEVTTGRLALSYDLTAQTTLRGAVATGYRAPVISELFGVFPVGGGFDFIGNPDLTPEESLSAELGIDHEFANGATLSATAFRLEVDNFIQYQDCTRDPVTFVCTSNATNANVPGTTTFQGLELAGTVQISNAVSLTGAYTYTDARADTGSRIARVPRHDLALVLDSDLPGNWSNSSTARAVSDVVNGTADYATLDTTFTYAFRNGTEAYFRIENVFDTQYQTVDGYGTSDRAFYAGVRAEF